MLCNRNLRILLLGVLGAALPLSSVAAQETQDSTSVAEAAKRAREQKQSAAKPSKVVTNDTLAPAAPSTANAPAANAANSSSNAAAAENSSRSPAGAPPAASPQDEPKDTAEIDSLKQIIKEKQQAADLLQRELSLDQDNFYRKQDYQRDSAGKQKLDGMQADLQQMLDELAALKAKLTDLAGPEALKEAPKTPTAPETPAPPAPPQP